MPHSNGPYIVRHPEASTLTVLDPGTDYDPKDVLVKAYPWAFEPRDGGRVIDSVPIEQATAAPGEKRSTRRRTSEE